MNMKSYASLLVRSVVQALCFFILATQAFGQWNGYVVLSDSTVAQPALATFQGRLFLAWAGTDGNHTMNVMSSADGLNYENKVILSGMWSADGYGPGLSAIPPCSTLMLSFEGGGHNVGISTSSDGISWGPQSNFGVYSTSTPVVTGAYGNFGAVAFKDSADRPHAYTFTSCAHSSVNVDCFIFLSNFFPPCADDGIPLNGSPGWATDRDVRAYSAANAGGQLNFGNNGGWVQAGTDHSDSGPSVAYNPANGHWYLAWRGAGGGINIRNLNTGATVISADWSPSTPVIAVFQGQLFAAWRGGSNNIVVGRTNLF